MTIAEAPRRTHFLVLGFRILASLVVIGCGPSPELTEEARRWVADASSAVDRGEYAVGLAFADSAVQSVPGHPAPHFIQGRVLTEMGRYAEADAAYERVGDIDENYPGLWLNRGNVAFTRQLYRQALNLYLRETLDEARVWHARGVVMQQLGLVDSARVAFESTVRRDSMYAPGRLSRSEFREQSGDLEGALLDARRAVDLDPERTSYQLHYGRLLAQAGRGADAIPRLRAVVDEEPWNYTARFALGRALLQTGHSDARPELIRADSARAAAQRVERLELNARDFPSLSNYVQYAEALRTAGRLEAALVAYNRAVSLDPDNLRVRLNLATLYAQTGQTEEAAERYRAILRADRDLIEGWLNLTVLYIQAGDARRAQVAFEQAQGLDPNHPGVGRLRTVLAGG